MFETPGRSHQQRSAKECGALYAAYLKKSDRVHLTTHISVVPISFREFQEMYDKLNEEELHELRQAGRPSSDRDGFVDDLRPGFRSHISSILDDLDDNNEWNGEGGGGDGEDDNDGENGNDGSSDDGDLV